MGNKYEQHKSRVLALAFPWEVLLVKLTICTNCKQQLSSKVPVVPRYAVSEVKVAQSCLTLCDLMDYTVHGILQARILEWVASLSPEDLPNPGIEPRSPSLQADSLPFKPQGKP